MLYAVDHLAYVTSLDLFLLPHSTGGKLSFLHKWQKGEEEAAALNVSKERGKSAFVHQPWVNNVWCGRSRILWSSQFFSHWERIPNHFTARLKITTDEIEEKKCLKTKQCINLNAKVTESTHCDFRFHLQRPLTPSERTIALIYRNAATRRVSVCIVWSVAGLQKSKSIYNLILLALFALAHSTFDVNECACARMSLSTVHGSEKHIQSIVDRFSCAQLVFPFYFIVERRPAAK